MLGFKFFTSAHITALDKIVHEDRRSSQPTVLIARSTVDDGLFAIERIQEGIYALCRLGNWVTVTTLERLKIASMDIAHPQKRHLPEQPRLQVDNWWSTATIDNRRAGSCGPSKGMGIRKTRGVRLCLQLPQQESTTPGQITQEKSQSIFQGQNENVLKDMMEDGAQDPVEVLKMVQAQYQESLYTSKVSLPCNTNISLTANFSPSHHWHILRKDHCLELEPF